MQLELLHPEVAFRNCDDCIKYVFEEEGPLIGQIKMWRGQPLERPPGTVPLCRREGCKCPKGTPEKPVKLSQRNRQFWQYFKKCKLTGRWPEDDWCLTLATALQDALEEVEQVRRIQVAQITAAQMTARL